VWLVGLGNPGSRYDGTRHNVGFDVARRLVERWRARPEARTPAFQAWQARVPGGAGREVTIVEPLLYMNKSGEAIAAYEAAQRERVAPAESLIVCDDIYLPLGAIRLRARGTTGGHNGLASVQAHFGTADYPRLRIGVGHASGQELIDHVLSRFADDERETVDAALGRAVEACETWARDGVVAAMNRFNQTVRAEVPEDRDTTRNEGESS
jgi:PTH1 family peptidyl-tRNA hydrolase